MSLNITQIDPQNSDELYFVAKAHLETPALWMENYKIEENEIKDTIQQLSESFKKNRSYLKCIREDEKIVSFLWAEITKYDASIVEIISLWTAPNSRKKGYATELKKEFELWSKEQKVIKIVTTVSAKNPKMFSLNIQLGYEVSSYKMVETL